MQHVFTTQFNPPTKIHSNKASINAEHQIKQEKAERKEEETKDDAQSHRQLHQQEKSHFPINHSIQGAFNSPVPFITEDRSTPHSQFHFFHNPVTPVVGAPQATSVARVTPVLQDPQVSSVANTQPDPYNSKWRKIAFFHPVGY